MRWIAFLVLTGLVLTFQTSLAPRLAWGDARLDGLMVLVLFYALHAPAPMAAYTGVILGACADGLSLEPIGVFAVAYGLVGLLVFSLRDYLFILDAVVLFVLTFGIEMVIQVAFLLYRLAHPVSGPPVWGADLVTALKIALITAPVFPMVQFILLRGHRLLGVHPPRYRAQGRS